MVERAYVGLGANLGDPASAIGRAIDAIGALAATRVTARSALYRSAPIGYADQPEFINAVIELHTGLAPEQLLAALHEIEQSHGRERSFANAPRTLDLDLLLHGERVRATPALTLPHPRMHERAFVLAPLLEIAPAMVIPGRGRARDLFQRCSDQRVVRLNP